MTSKQTSFNMKQDCVILLSANQSYSFHKMNIESIYFCDLERFWIWVQIFPFGSFLNGPSLSLMPGRVYQVVDKLNIINIMELCWIITPHWGAIVCLWSSPPPSPLRLGAIKNTHCFIYIISFRSEGPLRTCLSLSHSLTNSLKMFFCVPPKIKNLSNISI